MRDGAPRSLLFVPANRPDFAAKAASRGADAVVVDLEDAVPAGEKQGARRVVPDLIAALEAEGVSTWLRINSLESGGRDDVAALGSDRHVVLLVPKVSGTGDVRPLLDLGRTFVATIEDAAGAWSLLRGSLDPVIEASAGLALGTEDLSLSMGVEPTAEALSLPARALTLAAAAFGRPAYGVLGSIAAFDPLDRFEAACRAARRLGFSGALCIHPAQVAIANTVFSPTTEEIGWACAVVERAEGGAGVGRVGGAMVDRPILERAHATLRRARRP